MLAAPIDWASLQVAGAFAVGALVGSLATMRVGRAVLEYLRPRRK